MFSAITPAEGDAFLTSAMMPNELALSDFLKPRNEESFRAFPCHSAECSMRGSISVLLWAMISAKRFILVLSGYRRSRERDRARRFVLCVGLHKSAFSR